MTDSVDRSSGIGRTSVIASVGTLGSSLLGFGRNLALAGAIGTGLVADSYNIANQIPNQVFLLLGGGTIFFVFVPQLMRHAKTSNERADEYGSFLLLASAGFGAVVAALLLVLSPLAIDLMGGSSWSEAQSSLGLSLSFWCFPQVFFYAIYTIASQVMNARGRFTAVAWMPTVNSLTIILACLPIIILGTVQANSPDTLAAWEVTLLGGSTLLGSALQAGILLVLLRRAGFRLRLRFKIRGLGLRVTASMGILTLASVACYQLANLTTAALSTQAGSAAKALGYDGRGYTAMFYAQTLLYVAGAVASASMASVLLQRLSSHYAERDNEAAAQELNEALLAIGAILIPVASVLVCLGPIGTELLFARGETGPAAAHFIGIILAVLATGLVPYTLHDLLIRPFYAVNDAKTPLRSGAVIGSVWILGSLAAVKWLPPPQVLIGIAASFVLAYVIDLPLKFHTLNSRLQFRLAGYVKRGYAVALGASVLASAFVGAITVYIEPSTPQHWFARTTLFLGGSTIFVIIYYPLTARSPASLRRLVRWLRK